MNPESYEEALRLIHGNEETKPSDMVNNPPHYNKSEIECIEAIAAATHEGFEYYLQGNILKYIWRYRYKSGVQDLEKAAWYLDKLIQRLEEEDDAKR
jgi:hypothetical protein